MAKGIFERTLTVSCDDCKARKGSLCNSQSVWVHISRVEKARGGKVHVD